MHKLDSNWNPAACEMIGKATIIEHDEDKNETANKVNLP
jgi:hypothetical protein